MNGPVERSLMDALLSSRDSEGRFDIDIAAERLTKMINEEEARRAELEAIQRELEAIRASMTNPNIVRPPVAAYPDRPAMEQEVFRTELRRTVAMESDQYKAAIIAAGAAITAAATAPGGLTVGAALPIVAGLLSALDLPAIPSGGNGGG